jgi:hypothetical protein
MAAATSGLKCHTLGAHAGAGEGSGLHLEWSAGTTTEARSACPRFNSKLDDSKPAISMRLCFSQRRSRKTLERTGVFQNTPCGLKPAGWVDCGR